MSDEISREIDRLRSSYHYYKKKPDLISKCHAECILSDMNDLKALKKAIKFQERKEDFLKKYPQYRDILSKV